MDLINAICQGLGLALAVGVGGALIGLLAGALASLELGFDPEGTDYGFVAEGWFLLALLGVVVAGAYLRGRQAARYLALAAAAAIGAILAAASLAEEGEPAAIGLLAGAVAGLGAALLAASVLEGAQRRAQASDSSSATGAANTLILIFAAAGALIALIAVLVPPLSIAVAAGLGWLARGRRRRAEEKYEGLRILR